MSPIVNAIVGPIRAINPIGAAAIFVLAYAAAMMGPIAGIVVLAFLGGLYLDRRPGEILQEFVAAAESGRPAPSARVAAMVAQTAAAVAARRPVGPPPLPAVAAAPEVAPVGLVATATAPGWPNAAGLPGGLVVSQITLKQPTAAATKQPKPVKSKIAAA